MDIATYLNTMRDPAGLPFYPVIFQFLLVLTFALHITMVNLVIGSTFVAIWEIWKKNEYGLKLAKALGRVLTVGMSIAIVLGVAPLLFVQVIYDPFWYTATTLSAFWALMFLIVITLAFYAGYGFYLGNKKADTNSAKTGWAWVAGGLLLLTALLIHMLSMEQLMPQHWKQWVVSSSGSVSYSGGEFHGIEFGRLLHFILPSFAVTGVFLMLYSAYFQDREDFDKAYLDYVGRKGAWMALWSSALAIGAGFWWLGLVPNNLHFARNPLFLLGAIMGVTTTAYIGSAVYKPKERAISSALLMFGTIFVMCCAREALRMKHMAIAGYSIYNYPVNADWPSTILFFATFVMGIFVLYFPALAAFKSGRIKAGEVATLDPSLGKKAVSALIGWFVIVAGLGLIVSIKNGTLF